MDAVQWPSVTFLLPVLNGGTQLPGLLNSIKSQDYPGKVEIIMADGGSRDDSLQIAARYGVKVIANPHVLAEPGNALALPHATGDIIFYVAADNGLPRPDWLRLMVKPFIDDPQIMATYTQIVPSPGDNAFTEYYCRLHVEPFTWFVYGKACNTRDFAAYYPVQKLGQGWVVYKFTPMDHPLIAFAQGFGVRRSFQRQPEFDHDDILPVIQMIAEDKLLAYVPTAGVYHHHLSSFSHFVSKYRWRISNSLGTKNAGFDNRARFLSPARRWKKYGFAIYGLSLVWPIVDAVRLACKERRLCMFWHAPASTALSWIATTAVLKNRRNRRPGPSAQGVQ